MCPSLPRPELTTLLVPLLLLLLMVTPLQRAVLLPPPRLLHRLRRITPQLVLPSLYLVLCLYSCCLIHCFVCRFHCQLPRSLSLRQLLARLSSSTASSFRPRLRFTLLPQKAVAHIPRLALLTRRPVHRLLLRLHRRPDPFRLPPHQPLLPRLPPRRLRQLAITCRLATPCFLRSRQAGRCPCVL